MSSPSAKPPIVDPPRLTAQKLLPWKRREAQAKAASVSGSEDATDEAASKEQAESAGLNSRNEAEDFPLPQRGVLPVAEVHKLPEEHVAESPESADVANSGGSSASSRATAQLAVLPHPAADVNPKRLSKLTMRKIWRWPLWAVSRSWELVSLLLILAIVAAVPVLQLASLGYLLTAAANLARGKAWSKALPGLHLAGRLGSFAVFAAITWLPVWLVTDLAYSAQLLQPDSELAFRWRLGAFGVNALWVTNLLWAAVRGGRWWHLLWPAPLRFLKEAWRPQTWSRAGDRLFDWVASFRIPALWWLGLRAAVGALLWITLPVSMMIIGQRAEDFGPAGLVGLLGAICMTLVMLYLPFLQVQMAMTNRFSAIFGLRSVRARFRYAPWAHAFALFFLCLSSIPLYLLRIEATPEELIWAPALVFVVFMLPAKIFLGACMGYADRRQSRAEALPAHWSLRWTASMLSLASVLVYVGALYVAQLIAGQGAFVMYFQHAFLVPAPLV